MKKTNKTNKKTEKPAVVKEKTKKTPEAPITAKETKNEEIEEATVIEEVKTPAASTKTVKVEKKKEEEQPVEVSTEDVEQSTEEVEEEPVAPIGKGLDDISNERIDANHQIDLMNLIHKEYVSNPNASPTIQVAMKKEFDAMAMIALMRYNNQVERDFQTLGIKVTNTLAVQMEKVAREVFGITLKGLPAPDDPNQKVINFSESIPKEEKEMVKKDEKAEQKPIVEASPDLPEEEKVEVLQSIFSSTKNGGIGSNLLRGIEWARKAYSFKDDAKKAFILANILSRDISTGVIRAIRGMVIGKLSAENSIIGAHSLLKKWIPVLPDKEIAELMHVFAAAAIENRTHEWNEKSNQKTDLEKEYELVNARIQIGCRPEVITAIEEKKPELIINETKPLLESVVVKAGDIRNTMIVAYGDSDDILNSKITELAGYYNTPIHHLSDYVSGNLFNF